MIWPFKPNIEKLKAEADVDRLIKALKHRNPRVKIDAALALIDGGQLQGREQAASILGDRYDLRAVEPLLSVVKSDREAWVRDAAIGALGHIHDASAMQALISLATSDPTGWVRKSAIERLVYFRDVRTVEPFISMLQSSGSEWETTSNNSLTEKRIDERAESITAETIFALGEIGDARAVEPLISVLQNSTSETVIKSTIIALSKMGGARAVEPLVSMFIKNSNPDVIIAAIEGLEKIGEESVDHLISLLSRKRQERWRVVDALGRISDARAVEPLVSLLNNLSSKRKTKSNNFVTEKIIMALGEIGDERVVEPVISVAKNHNQSFIKETTIEVIKKIGGPRAFEYIVEELQNTDYDVKTAAAIALGQVGDDRAIDILTDIVEKGSLRSWQATCILSKFEDERVIPALLHSLHSLDEIEDRKYIANAIKRIYRSRTTSKETKKLIIKHQSYIEKPHEDYKEEHPDAARCEMLPYPYIYHVDRGIGIKL